MVYETRYFTYFPPPEFSLQDGTMLFITGEELHTEGLLPPPHPPLLHGLPEELHPPELQGLPAVPTDEIKYIYQTIQT